MLYYIIINNFNIFIIKIFSINIVSINTFPVTIHVINEFKYILTYEYLKIYYCYNLLILINLNGSFIPNF